jgi:hypothetical protein
LAEDDAMKTPEELASATNAVADESVNGASQPPTPANGVPPMSQEVYDAKNKQRLALIKKKYHGGGLTTTETEELARLEKETDQYVAAIFPLSFEIFEKMKELARKDGISLEGYPE